MDPIKEYISPYAEDINKIINNNPQKKLFWDLFLNPESETFGNASGSALKAGWTDSGAKVVTQQRWFKSNLRRVEMKDTAEVVLQEMLALPKTRVRIIKGQEVVEEDPALVKIKQDTAKYITSTLSKKHYSTRVENTGKDGGAQEHKVDISDEVFNNIVNAYGKRKSGDKKGDA